MNGWEPTIGKWNDNENYDVYDLGWRNTWCRVSSWYDRCGVTREFKDNGQIKQMPYSAFVRGVLSVLTDEAKVTDDYTLTLAVLAGVTELTDCSAQELEVFHVSGISEELEAFPCRNTDDSLAYYTEVLSRDCENATLHVLLAQLLFSLKEETCPYADWAEDVARYRELEKRIEALLDNTSDGGTRRLCNKIKERLAENEDISRNRNKTAQELFAGWND